MLQLLVGTNIPFMKYRRIFYLFSGALLAATVIWLVVHGGPKMSVDFTGGTLLQVELSQTQPVDRIRHSLDEAGFRGAEIQTVGETGRELLLRFGLSQSADAFPRVKQTIESSFPGTTVQLRRSESVGPKVGKELGQRAVWAILLSMLGILVYVGIRYEFKFALGAVIALFHDVVIVLGILCFAGREISLTSVAALLTLAGYSINDTIVVFDRIRERSKQLSKETHERAFDIAVNETLSRTIITSFTVFLTSLSLYIFGGEVINDFALAMVAGVLFGTYSSIYVASALALEVWNWTDRRRKAVRARAA
jgi:preprotein translocase SecF subunit